MELRSLFLLLVLGVVGVIPVACEGSSREQAAAEPAAQADATETRAVDPPSQASKPEPRAESGNEGDEGGHTPEPDAVAHDRPPSSDLPAAVVGTIDAVQRGDAQYLRDLAEVVAVGCTYADGLGGPPKCAEGDAQGTVYEVFPFLGCHGGWVPLSELTALFEGLLPLTGELHAVVRLERGAGGDPFARGDTLIVFEPAGSPTAPEAVGLTLAGGRLVRADYGCRTADQMRIQAEGPVARTLDAVQRGDAQLLRTMAKVMAVACTHADGAGGRPKCAEGDAEGTGYEVFPFLGCQGGWVLASELTDLFEHLLLEAGELYAVVRLEEYPGNDSFWGADTVIVFEPAGSPTAPEAVGLTLAGGRLVRADYGCRTADQMRIEAEGPVARTLDAVQRGDAQYLRDLAKVMAVACTHADGAGGPPQCAEGDAEGTGYEVFPFLGCQGGWVLASELKDFFDELLPLTGELRAVARLERGAGGDPHTRGDTLIVFDPADSQRVTQAVGLALAGGRIVRVERGCRTADQMLRNPDGTSRERLHSPSRE